MPIATISLQVLPVVPEEKIYPVVDKVIEYIRSTGIVHVVGPMETTMEGEYDELMKIVRRSHEICIDEGAARVISVIKVDWKSEGVTIEEKIGKYR
ncbi:MAG: thiamine-binding protein [Saccharofermentanales bacterium]